MGSLLWMESACPLPNYLNTLSPSHETPSSLVFSLATYQVIKSVQNWGIMGIHRIYSIFTSSFSKLKFQSRTFSSFDLQQRLKNVGFIGLGNMGSHMARNLIKSGYGVSVCDKNINAVKLFLEKGVPVRITPAEIAEASDVIITMLPSSSHVMNVFMGLDGLLQNSRSLRPWLFIDCSTIDPLTSRKVSLSVSDCAFKEKLGGSITLVSSSYIGDGVGFENYRWDSYKLVGGPEEAYLAAESLFLSMGRSPIYCGGAGNGSVAKICNNLALAISMTGVSEALAIGQSLGVPVSTLTKIFNSSSARCWSSDCYNPVPGVMEGVPSSKNYQGGFASKLMAKDLDLAATSAKEADVKHPLTCRAQEIFHEICRRGNESKDFSCVFREYYGGKDEFPH